MSLKRILFILTILISSASVWAGNIGVVQHDKIYRVYGVQTGNGDFLEYSALLCYYKPEKSHTMVLLIEPDDKSLRAESIEIPADAWQAVEEDSSTSYVYEAANGKLKVVITPVDEEDALVIVMRHKKPDMSYLFARRPVDNQ